MLNDAPIVIAKERGTELETLKQAVRRAGLENPIQIVEPSQIEAHLTHSQDKGTAGLPLFCIVETSAEAILERIKRVPLFQNLPVIVLQSIRGDAPPARMPSTSYWLKPDTIDEWIERLVRLKMLIQYLECALPV